MQARLAIPFALFLTASCVFRPPSEGDSGTADPKANAADTAGDTQKPPPDVPPAEGTYYPPPTKQTEAYAGVNGPLPEELCGAGNYYSISAITPSPLDPLPENAMVTVTATVDYALEYPDTIQLESVSYTTYESVYSESISLEAGCGSVEVSFSFPTTGETLLLVGIQSYEASSIAALVIYDVGDAPGIRIVDTSIPAGSYIPATWSTITLTLSYETFGHEVMAWVYNGSDEFPLELTAESGTMTVDVQVGALSCNQEVYAEAGFYDITADRESFRLISWYLGPAMIITGESQVIGPTTAKQPFSVANCGSAPITGSIASDAAWLTPELTVLAVASRSEVGNWYTVDATGLEPGEHTGHITASAAGQSVSLQVALTVIDSSRFQAAAVSYAWDSSADAGKGTSLFSTGADESAASITVPFSLTSFGAPETNLFVFVNGVVSPDDVGAWYYQEAPSDTFTRSIFVDFDDLMVGDSSQSIRYAVAGASPNRRLVISFNDVQLYYDDLVRHTFQIIFYEGQSRFRVQYGAMDSFGVTGIGDGASVFTKWPAASNTAFDVTPQ